MITWLLTCAITISTGAGAFAVTDTKRYVPVRTLSAKQIKIKIF